MGSRYNKIYSSSSSSSESEEEEEEEEEEEAEEVVEMKAEVDLKPQGQIFLIAPRDIKIFYIFQ